jgi:polysaccharide biosynthesis transport protein
MLLRLKNALNDLGGTVLGIVLNNVDVRHDEQYRFYTTYSAYYSKSVPDRNPIQKADATSSNEEDEY